MARASVTARAAAGSGSARDWSAPLLGRNSRLDSLELVMLVVAIERRLAERFQATLTLADEKALSRSQSPFRTLSALADYAAELLEASSRG